MNKPKVSVVVPVYNVEDYLRRCLDSLVNQTLEDIEIIVVNDGSPDNSQDIIDEYVEKYPGKVKGLIKENGGLSDARNFGIPNCKGEYVAFVDSDDYVDLTMYEKLYNEAITKKSEIVVCGYFKVNDQDLTMKSAQMGSMELYDKSAKEEPQVIEANAPYAWNKLVKRTLLEKTGIRFPKGYIFEDICTMYPLIAAANKVSKVDEELYYYIVERQDSITGTFNKSKTLVIKSLRLLDERFKELGLFDDFRDPLVAINLRHIYFRFKEFIRYKDRLHQFKLVNDSFNLLGKYFPDWRHNSGTYIYFTLHKDRHIKRWFYKRRWYWYLAVLLPLRFIRWFDEYTMLKFRKTRLSKRYYSRIIHTKRIVPNRVLFESFHGQNISDSPYYMMKELYDRGGYKIYATSQKKYWKENRKFLDEQGLKKVKLVELKTKKYHKIMATAKYLINNVSFPICFVSRPGQIYLNTWHGTPLKTLGKKMKKGIESMTNIQHNFLQADYNLYPNKFTKDVMMEDYNLDKLFTKKTIIGGYPRNAIFSDKEAGEAVKKQLGLEGKRVYAYMPTWRGVNSYSKMQTTAIEEVLAHFDDALGDNDMLFVNLHPNVDEEIDYSKYKHIEEFPTEVQNYEFVNSVDVLITDYSSIFFDFSITRKPIVLFMYDYEDYMADRGMYFDIKDLPFKKIYDMEEMCNALKNDECKNFTYNDATDYFEKYLKHDSIDATKKLVDFIFDGKQGDLIVDDYSHNKEKRWKLVVQPKRIETKEEYDEFLADHDLENTVFAIRNRLFHRLMNDWFYNEYNDKVTYVIYTYCRLIGPVQEKIFKTKIRGLGFIKKRIRAKGREMAYKRSLPGIKITNKDEIKKII